MARFATVIKTRNKFGSQIAELPPALILLLMLIFLPLLNLLYICVAYCAGWYLNQLEVRQITFQPPQLGLTATMPPGNSAYTYSNSPPCGPQTNPALPELPQSQSWNGFLGVTESGESPQVIYLPLVVNGVAVNQVGQAQVTTTVSIKPFFSENTTWMPKIPGLTDPLTFSYRTTGFQEEQAAAPPVIKP